MLFVKKSNGKKVKVDLPCWTSLTTTDGHIYNGIIHKKTGTNISLIQYHPDSTSLANIASNKSLKRKERNRLIDSLCQADTSIVALKISEIERFSIPWVAVKKKLYWILASTNLTILATSGIGFMAGIPAEGSDQKLSLSGAICAAIYPLSFTGGLMLASASKNFNKEKWELICD